MLPLRQRLPRQGTGCILNVQLCAPLWGFSRIQQKFDRLHTKFDDLCTRAGLRSASVDEAEKMHRSAAKIQAHKRGKNARRDARKAKESAGRGSPVARNALLDAGDSSGRASPDVPGERAAVM